MIKLKLLILSCCLLLSACATVDSQTLFAQAKQHFFTRRYDLALKEFMPFALQDNAKAQYAVGYIYYYGLGGAPRNLDLARGWMKLAAAHGYVPAIKALSMLDSTDFIPPNK